MRFIAEHRHRFGIVKQRLIAGEARSNFGVRIIGLRQLKRIRLHEGVWRADVESLVPADIGFQREAARTRDIAGIYVAPEIGRAARRIVPQGPQDRLDVCGV